LTSLVHFVAKTKQHRGWIGCKEQPKSFKPAVVATGEHIAEKVDLLAASGTVREGFQIQQRHTPLAPGPLQECVDLR
jgi:hypothetical protein